MQTNLRAKSELDLKIVVKVYLLAFRGVYE